jgi:catechol 2,3-dioxygenase-like lactoylglutathione lyase family enzyme
MAKLRHIALSVPDPEASARFYCEALGMKVVGEANSATATGVYLSDGTISLALLRYRTDAAAGERGKDFVGLHHIGFLVDDLDEASRQAERSGATIFQDVPREKTTEFYEKKYRDPDGIIFDITHSGWKGAAK